MPSKITKAFLGKKCVRDAVSNDPYIRSLLDSVDAQTATTGGTPRSTWLDRQYERYVNFMLSSPKTQGMNIVSNTVPLVSRLADTFAEAAVSKLRFWAPQDRVYFREVLAEAGGLAHGTVDALRFLGKRLSSYGTTESILSEMKFPTRLAEQAKIERTHRAITAEATGREGMLGRLTDIEGALVNFPGNTLGTADIFYKVINFRAQLARDAMHEAMSNGLRGDALRAHVDDYVSSALNGSNSRGIAAGLKDADYRTFTNIPTEGLSAAMAQYGHSLGLLRWIVPFRRTAVNVAAMGLEHTPLGLLGRQFRTGTPMEKQAALARALAGSAILGGLYAWLGDDLVGKAPSNPDTKILWNRDGHEEYTIKTKGPLGNIPFDSLGPLGVQLQAMADYRRLVSSIDMDNDPNAIELLLLHGTAMGTSTVNAMMDNHWIPQIASFVGALDQGRKHEDWGQMQSLLGRMVTAATVPAIISKGVTQALDPEVKDIRSPWDFFLSKVPMLSESIPGKVDLWGQPVTYDNFNSPDFIDPITGQDPVSAKMRELKVRIPETRRTVGQTPMTPEEYQRMKMYAGQGDPSAGVPPLRESIKELMRSPSFKALQHDEARAAIIEDMIADYNSFGREMLMRDPHYTFGKRYQASQLQKMEKMQ